MSTTPNEDDVLIAARHIKLARHPMFGKGMRVVEQYEMPHYDGHIAFVGNCDDQLGRYIVTFVMADGDVPVDVDEWLQCDNPITQTPIVFDIMHILQLDSYVDGRNDNFVEGV